MSSQYFTAPGNLNHAQRRPTLLLFLPLFQVQVAIIGLLVLLIRCPLVDAFGSHRTRRRVIAADSTCGSKNTNGDAVTCSFETQPAKESSTVCIFCRNDGDECCTMGANGLPKLPNGNGDYVTESSENSATGLKIFLNTTDDDVIVRSFHLFLVGKKYIFL